MEQDDENRPAECGVDAASHVATKEEIDEARTKLLAAPRSAKAGATGILRWDGHDLVARTTKLTAKLQNVGF